MTEANDSQSPGLRPSTHDPAALPSAKLPKSPAILINFHGDDDSNKLSPPLPKYPSPMRQHKRTPSQHREIKETLDAVADIDDNDEDGSAHHKINQYTIKDLIGRGSYASVHLATDNSGKEYAVKEFSKARMRKRARSELMRRGPFRAGPSGSGPGRPFGQSRMDKSAQAEADDALHFIREEVAIMKKLNHQNLVALIEVLDDPDQDSLYMVLEMCKKGAIIDVDIGKTAIPYDSEASRTWFRDLILGIEYLHRQNVVHRDIKPDNLLITEDDVLKIADFGVSEMFGGPDSMRTAKSAGSPAFLPPELCVAHHGDVSGPACDIWSMGVTLYCLRYGRIPFERDTIPGIYDAITTTTAELPPDEDENFVDLMSKILEKDPGKRISMGQLREHPWVTNGGSDLLLSAEENCANPIEPPNALELNHAFTRRMNHLFCVLKAIGKFKGLMKPKDSRRRSRQSAANMDDSTAHLSAALNLSKDNDSPSEDDEVARLVAEMRENKMRTDLRALQPVDEDVTVSYTSNNSGIASGARSSGTRDGKVPPPVVLGIGAGGGDNDFSSTVKENDPEEFVSESPVAADFDVYDRAFQTELHRIQSHHSARRPKLVFPNKVAEGKGIQVDSPVGAPHDRSFFPDSSSGNVNDSVMSGTEVGSSVSAASEAASAGAGRSPGTGTSGFSLANVVARAMRESNQGPQNDGN